MVPKKSKSKRTTLRMKYKVQKKVKEANRKARKEARANPGAGRKGKKDPGIPNLWPFKEALVKQMERQQEAEAEAKKQQKDKRKALIEQKRKETEKKVPAVALVDRSSIGEEDGEAKGVDRKLNQTDVTTKRHYFKELRKVIEASDVILQILDARDPEGCRSKEFEKEVVSTPAANERGFKRLILVLNKIDLVPEQVVEQWVKFYKRQYPCVAFKSSTQEQRARLTQATSVKASGSACVGAQDLLHVLKNYCRSLKMKKNIVVGIIGYPNVGKSSLINSLKRSRAVGVSAMPGFTTALQVVKLDKQISLIDSPGVLFSAAKKGDDDGILLRNVVKVQDIDDPVAAVSNVVNKTTMETLCETYEIGAFDGPEQFLMRVAIKRGKLGKGGVPNLKEAAKAVLKDWNEGKIPYYTVPPKEDSKIMATEVVTSFADEFDIDKLLAQGASVRTEAAEDDDDEEEEDDDEEMDDEKEEGDDDDEEME